MEEMQLRVRFGLGGQGWLAFDAKEPSSDPGDKWEVCPRMRSNSVWTPELLADWRWRVEFDSWRQKAGVQGFL